MRVSPLQSWSRAPWQDLPYSLKPRPAQNHAAPPATTAAPAISVIRLRMKERGAAGGETDTGVPGSR